MITAVTVVNKIYGASLNSLWFKLLQVILTTRVLCGTFPTLAIQYVLTHCRDFSVLKWGCYWILPTGMNSRPNCAEAKQYTLLSVRTKPVIVNCHGRQKPAQWSKVISVWIWKCQKIIPRIFSANSIKHFFPWRFVFMESAQKPAFAQFFMYLRNKREQNI